MPLKNAPQKKEGGEGKEQGITVGCPKNRERNHGKFKKKHGTCRKMRTTLVVQPKSDWKVS